MDLRLDPVSLAATNRARLDEMLVLYTRAMREVAARSYDAGAIEAWIAGRNPGDYLAAETAGVRFILAIGPEGTLAGFASWKPGELAGLYVAPEHHGQGIGSRLFADCDRAASEVGAPIRRIRVSLNAVGFYERHGFRTVRRSTMSRPNASLPIAEMERTP